MSGTFLRFLLVGGSFSLIYSLTTAGLIGFAGTPAFVTSVIVYLLCIPAAYYFQKRFAFGVETARRAAFPLYVATQALGLSIVSGATALFVTHVFWADTLLLLTASAVAAVISFLITRFVTFAPKG